MNARPERYSVMPASILDNHLKEMDASALKVYLYLARWANADGAMWHGQDKIAAGCGISVRSVIRAMTYLKSIGAVTLEKQGGINRGPNRYNVGTVGRKRNGALPKGDTHGTLEPPTGDTHVTRNVTPVSPLRVPPMSHKESVVEVSKEEVSAVVAPADIADDDFQKFWNAFPNKQNMIAARKAYGEALKEVSADVLLEQAKGYTRDIKVKKTDPGFVLTPTAWLAKKRWTDEYPKATVRRERSWCEVAE